MKLAVLEKIRSHLLNNPGEYKWSPIAVILKLDPIEIYDHLRWLRENGFTTNDKGRSFWTERTIGELRSMFPDQPIPIVRSVHKSKAPRYTKPPRPKVDRAPKPPKPPKVNVEKPPKQPKPRPKAFILRQCIKALEPLAFWHKSLAAIDRLVPGYDPQILRSAVVRSGGSVFHCKITKQTVYSKARKQGGGTRQPRSDD